VTADHDLVLHVGMPRASSIVGPALQRLRPQLRAHGIALLSGAQLERLPHASGWHRDPATDRKQTAAFARELAALARTERLHAGSLWRRRTVPVVIADAQLLGRGEIGPRDAEQLRPDAVAAVRQAITALSARNVLILLHTHRQDRMLELAYLRRLRSGQHVGIEQYFPRLFEPVMDYRDLVTRLRSIRDVSDVVVRPVELADAGMHAFINDVLGVIGLRNVLDLYVIGADLPLHPPVYSARGAAVARAMNPLVRGAESTLVHEYLAQRHAAPAEYGPPDILDLEARTHMLESYAETNRLLFVESMPDLPPDSYADDVTTFGLGNVLHQPAAHDRTVPSRLTVAAAVRANRASTALLTTTRPLRRRLSRAQLRRLERFRHRLT
jgi:hypothetical protein